MFFVEKVFELLVFVLKLFGDLVKGSVEVSVKIGKGFVDDLQLAVHLVQKATVIVSAALCDLVKLRELVRLGLFIRLCRFGQRNFSRFGLRFLLSLMGMGPLVISVENRLLNRLFGNVLE